MIGGIALLLGCELAGEALRAAFRLPIPGPVIGMVLLAVGLLAFGRRAPDASTARASTADATAGLDRVAGGLIANMGLLFVPAGVGVIAQAALLRAQWLPIVVALLGSTLLGLAATALVMRWTLPSAAPSRTRR